ncbi:EF-hand domain-containing protein [Lysobacter sp. Root494]|uniref:EF-hand domain-containing protein n=1 Tax=Lysobacter sp. Root494 TaxID=1736549 RepID=UPI0006FE1A21|nr:EF-hand domain-containing protein [Lysobacter sp. Root494]KQY52333.1 hypothetical protein ASD14_06780 [Lysobacter sp. Root494]
MKPSKIAILSAALSLAVVAGCNRADETARTEPATTTPSTTPDTTTTPSTTTPSTSTATTDTTGTPDTTTAPGIEPTTPVPPATTTADATTSFDDMDTNNDGSISQDELPDTSSLRQNFSMADKDGNGTLSRAEVDAQRANTMPPGG